MYKIFKVILLALISFIILYAHHYFQNCFYYPNRNSVPIEQ